MDTNLRKIRTGDVIDKIFFDTTKKLESLNENKVKAYVKFDNDDYIEYKKEGSNTQLAYYKNGVYNHTFYKTDLSRSSESKSLWLREDYTFDKPRTVTSVDIIFTQLSCAYVVNPKDFKALTELYSTGKPSLPNASDSLTELVRKVDEVGEYTDYLRTKLINNVNGVLDIFNEKDDEEESTPPGATPKPINVHVTEKKNYSSSGNSVTGFYFRFLDAETGKTIYRHAATSNIINGSGGDYFTISHDKDVNVLVLAESWYSGYEMRIYVNGIQVDDLDIYKVFSEYKVSPGDSLTLEFYNTTCLAKGTKITLANRTYKNIEDITYDDDILVWNFDEGRFDSAKPLWIKKAEITHKYNLLKFSNGNELRTIDQHRIFNKEKGMFTYPMTEDTPIGTTTFDEFGQETILISKEIIRETVEYYNVITDEHINLFANGVLTSCRYNNMYPIEDMKFRKSNNAVVDVDCNEIPVKFVNGLRLKEQPFTMQENIEYINNLLRLQVQ